MTDQYRQSLLDRVRERLHYPDEARELELDGQVEVHVQIDRTGRLRGATLRGACPHHLLCDDALRTVRAAAPFPPLPDELGPSLEVTLPLNYVFQ